MTQPLWPHLNRFFKIGFGTAKVSKEVKCDKKEKKKKNHIYLSCLHQNERLSSARILVRDVITMIINENWITDVGIRNDR